MPANSFTPDPMTGAHEERIQRLEENSSTLLVQSTAQGAELKHLSEKIDSNQTQVLSKLEEISTSVRARLEDGDQKFEALTKANAASEQALQALQTKERIREKKAAKLRATAIKVVKVLFAGVGGVFAHRFGLALWGFFH